MLLRKILLTTLLLTTVQAHAAEPAPADRIVARVNSDIITSGDVWNRYRMIQRSSHLPDNTDIRTEAFPQVLDSLIEEKLQLQEARRAGIKITDADIARGIAELATRNKMTTEAFQAGMAKDKISIDEVKEQMRAQLGWTGVIQRVIRPRISVSDGEVAKLAAELNARKGLKEYQIAEIRLPAANAQQKADSLKLANRLALEMSKGAPFRDVAAKFSTAPSAAKGGLRGWVVKGDLQPDIERLVDAMPVKTMTKPVVTDDGVWLTLKINERVNEGAPDNAALLERIGTRKLEQAADSHMRDLREEALIDFPSGS